MKRKIRKIDKDTYEEIIESDPVIYHIPTIEAKIVELTTQLNVHEPTDQELIELGRIYHPYFSNKISIEIELKRLQDFKDELKKN